MLKTASSKVHRNMILKYRNIAISGGAAVGKGTLRAGLKPYLAPLGWKFRSGGDLLREFTKGNKIPKASLADAEWHKKLDRKTFELLEEGNLVVESWLAGYVARERADTLRIFVFCSNDAIRIDRVVNRDHVDVETAKKIIFEREKDNFAEWRKIYGDHNFWDPKYFHLSLDTYSLNKKQTLQKILEALGYDTPLTQNPGKI